MHFVLYRYCCEGMPDLRLKLIGLVQRSVATRCLCCIRHMNRVNSHSGSVLQDVRTVNIFSVIVMIANYSLYRTL